MTLGIEGSGPYGRIRQLRTQVRQCKYELDLINRLHMRRPIGKKRLNELIIEAQEEIRTLLLQEKKRKEQGKQ